MSEVDCLSEPLQLASGAVLKNRIAKASMSERLAGDGGRPSVELERLYARWAEGGSGLVLTGNIMCSAERSLSPGVACFDEAYAADFLRCTRAGQATGSSIWAQLNHPGRQIPRKYVPEPLAPSSVRLTRGGWAFGRPRAMSEDDVQRLIASFASAARMAERFGFDGVQIHAAHGYLISQFLSPITNQRDDQWGGSAEGRRRFLLEVVRRVRATVGGRFSVGVKLNSADFQKGGMSEDESMGTIEALNQEGVDLLEISGGTYERAANIETDRVGAAQVAGALGREAYFLRFAEQARSVASMHVMLTGGFRSRAGMNKAIRDGSVDVVGLARPLAVHPGISAELLRGGDMTRLAYPSRSGFRILDTIVEVQWYASQMALIGSGQPSNPRLTYRSQIVRALRKYL